MPPGSPTSSRSPTAASCPPGPCPSPEVPSQKGASARATPSARAGPTRSGRHSALTGQQARPGPPLPRGRRSSMRTSPSTRTVRRTPRPGGSWRRSVTRWMTVAPTSAGVSVASGRGRGRASPWSSLTTTRRGPGKAGWPGSRVRQTVVVSAASRSSAPSSPASSSTEGATRRRKTGPSSSVRILRWGRRDTQSQACSRSWGKTRARWRSSGAWRTAAWVTRARASAVVASRGPTTATSPAQSRSRVAGRSGWRAWRPARTCASRTSMGSSSAGRVRGMDTRGLAASAVPTRTCRKSGSWRRRSQRRAREVAHTARAVGSGWVAKAWRRSSRPTSLAWWSISSRASR